MTIVQLRAEVPDEPGQLGRMAAAITGCGAIVVGIDVQFADGTAASAAERSGRLTPPVTVVRRRRASFFRAGRRGARL